MMRFGSEVGTMLAAASATSDSYLVAALVLGGIALLLLTLEVFIPTGGILALLCGACGIASVVAMFMWSTTGGLILLLVYTVAAPFLILVLLKLWSRSPIARALMLQDSARPVIIEANEEDIDPEDPDASRAASDAARRRRMSDLAQLIGRRGVSETPLRPAGFISLDGRRVDAVAESGLIEAGMPVRVVEILDGVLKVRAES